jgi:hypothetical protein
MLPVVFDGVVVPLDLPPHAAAINENNETMSIFFMRVS